MRKIVCITGMDGTGKSTLVKKLSETFPSSFVSNIWDIIEGDMKIVLFQSKRDIDSYLCSLSPDSRLLFLAHALKFSIDRALSFDNEIIIINAYYYKYFATELALGASEKLVSALIDNFPDPTCVIHLSLPPEMAAARKDVYSRYECGISKKPNSSEFIEFQNKVATKWDKFSSNTWHKIDARLSVEQITQESIRLINGK